MYRNYNKDKNLPNICSAKPDGVSIF